ncbi:MAG: protein kinase [Candidatus Hydrogenedentes bacterium]|nr:protein kinase [Candidatus Hydrogenedentota bacterium]
MREYDLLVGILACQLRLVSRGSLVHFAAALRQTQDQSLLEYLVDSKALSEKDQAFLCRIVDTIIHAHHGDEKSALKAFGGDEAAREVFSGSIAKTDQGWGPAEDQTILAEILPHGLPPQILPETIGRYTRGSEYARGGIGRILLVHDEQIGRDVILKELLPEHIVSPTDSTLSQAPQPESPRSPMRRSAAMMARFLQEAKITGQLEHPSIVPVYELGTRKDGQLYYTMKLVRGETLAESIKNCKNPEDRLGLLRSFLDVCQAMAYAHSKGVIHRDLKPSNIMVGEFGECVVLDWGLAKMQKDMDAHRDALEKTISQLKLGEEPMAEFKTRSKDIMGTPLYMAPEQARGEVDAVGVQSDVYSLGVVLYEILTGDLPHPWSNSIDTIRRVGTLPAPSILRAAPHTPPELAAICDKALAFHPGKRYTSAKELASDVQHFLEGAVVGAYAYKFSDMLGRLYRRHRVMINTGLASVAALLAIGAFSYWEVYNAGLRESAARTVAEQNAASEKDARQKEAAARAEAEASLKIAERQQYLAQIRLAQAHIGEQQMRLANQALDEAPESERDWLWRFLRLEANPELLNIRNDRSAIVRAHYDPTGQFIVAMREFEPPGLWNAETGDFIADFQGSANKLYGVAFDRSGSLFAGTGSGGYLAVWELPKGTLLHEHTGPSEGIALSFSDDGHRIWVGALDGTITEREARTGNILRTIEGSGRAALVVREFPDKNLLLIHYDNTTKQGVKDTIVALGLNDLKRQYQLDGIGIWVTPDGQNFLRADHHGATERNTDSPVTIQYDLVRFFLHDVQTGESIEEFEGHYGRVFGLDFTKDGRRFVSTSDDGQVRMWSRGKKEFERAFGTGGAMRYAYFLDGEDEIVGCSDANRFVVWDVATGTPTATFLGQNKELGWAELSPDRKRLVSSSQYHAFQIFNAKRPPGQSAVALARSTTLEGNPRIEDLCISRDETKAILKWNTGELQALDLNSMRWLSRFETGNKTMPRLSLSSDGTLVLYCRDKNLVEIGNVLTGTSTALPPFPFEVTATLLADDNESILVATSDGGIHKSHISNPEATELSSIPSVVRAFCLLDAGAIVAMACDDGRLRIAQFGTLQVDGEVLVGKGTLLGVVASIDGKRLCTVASDGTVTTWNAETWERMGDFQLDDWTAPGRGDEVSMRPTFDGRQMLIHNQFYRTSVLDLTSARSIAQPFWNMRVEELASTNTVIKITSRGALTKHSYNRSLIFGN